MVEVPERVNILGVGVQAVDMPLAVRMVEAAAREGRHGYVCVTGVHGIMESQDDPALKRIQNRSLLTVPDGMPTVWIGRLRGFSGMRRVYGPDLMLEVCRRSVTTGLTHFLYGGQEGVAEQLKRALESRFPGLAIVGTYTPPFRPLTSDEEEDLRRRVSQCNPDYFWVGLSTPKQERFMAAHLGSLETRILLGVGAAFDVHTGRIKDAPDWIKRAGLQWLHRLVQEPRRLGPRYLVNNPKFILRVLLQSLRLRRYDL